MSWSVETIDVEDYVREIIDELRQKGEDPYPVARTYLKLHRTMTRMLQEDEGMR